MFRTEPAFYSRERNNDNVLWWNLPQLSSVMWRCIELPGDCVFSLTGTLCHHFLLALQCTLGKAPLDCIKAIDTEQCSWKKKPLTDAPHPLAHFSDIALLLRFSLHARWYGVPLKIFRQTQKSSKLARLWISVYTAAVRGAEHALAKRREMDAFPLQFDADLMTRTKSYTSSGAYIRSHQLNLTSDQFLKKFDI